MVFGACRRVPGKPVAHDSGLISSNSGLLWISRYFGGAGKTQAFGIIEGLGVASNKTQGPLRAQLRSVFAAWQPARGPFIH